MFRLHFVFFSALLPVLGASTVQRALPPRTIAALVGAGLCLHVFAYLLNDVIDLPVDRTQPLRRLDPLVRGAVTSRQVLAVALAGVPATVPLTRAIGGGVPALAVLGVGFGCMAVYNVYGKRAAIPPLTDAVQGIAWGSLAPYGALAVGGTPNTLTWIVAAHGALFILVINGVHGGLRDLANDLARGARTTAIALGARPLEGHRIVIPAPLRLFATAVTVAVVAVDLFALLRNDFGYGTATRRMLLAATTGLDLVALGLLAPMLWPRWGAWRLALRLHLFVLLMLLPVAFAPFVSTPVLVTLTALLAISVTALVGSNGGAIVPDALRPADAMDRSPATPAATPKYPQ